MKKHGTTLMVTVVTAWLFGIVSAPLMAPLASADALPNGYSMICVPNGTGAICTVSGCPRVYADEAGDVVHVKLGGGDQVEKSKACNNDTVVGEYPNIAMTFSIQGCRKHSPGSDDCGAWSDYHYNPPASAPAPAAAPAPAVNCPAGSKTATVPAGQQCQAAPPVNCPAGSVSPTVPAGQQCQAAPPVNCPTGSVSATVPAGQQCAAPTSAVKMNIKKGFPNADVAVTNDSALPAQCVYKGTKTSGFGPQEVDRTINVGPHGTGHITDMLSPPLGTSYNASVTCTVTYNGKQTSIGQASQPVSG